MDNLITPYLAHSEKSLGVKQTIKEHSLDVGKMMRKFALSASFADLYEFCGFIHDMGRKPFHMIANLRIIK